MMRCARYARTPFTESYGCPVDRHERDAIRAAFRRMFEENIFPYRLAGEAAARGLAEERAEREWLSQFLPGHSGPTATAQVEPPARDELQISYAPDVEGEAAPGEIVRTWVPIPATVGGGYESVLLIAVDGADRLYAVRLSTVSHIGGSRFFDIGAGAKDSHGRLAWVDVDRLYTVHRQGIRRTGFTMDRPHFIRVADELYLRHGWAMTD